MKESKIHNLFPVPIYMSDIDRKFTTKELNFVNNQKNYTIKNEGNINTKDNYILNRKEFKSIKKFIDKSCEDYLHKIICPKEKLKLYVTQSWLNYTEENQFHHQHAHPNSIISGVLYFNSDNDNIKFLNPKQYNQISPQIDENKYNIWNSSSWWFGIETGQLIMFPSSTNHQVDSKKGNNTRISLAFNTFFKGTLGLNKSLTELIL